MLQSSEFLGETIVSERSFQLIVRRGPKPGQTFPLVGPSISLGRDPMSDLTLSDPEVSRYHAQLTQTATGYQIQDMGSTNGTYIDDDRLTGDPRLLHPGQAIQLGSGVILEYQAVGAESGMMATLVDGSADLPPSRPMVADPTEASELGALPPLPEFDDDYVAPISQPSYTPEQHFAPEPPPASPQFVQPPPPPPLVAADDVDGGRRRRRIIILLIVLLILCCCAFLVTGWFVWGDPLLDFLTNEGLINF